MAMVALRVVRSTLPRALYLDMARLTTRGLTRSRRPGMRLARTRRPIVPARSMAGPGGDAGGEDDLVAGGVEGDGEAGAVGVGAGDGGGGVGDRGAQRLVGDQQGLDLLLDAVGGAGAQDAAAEDGGLELKVGGLDLPALVVEGRQFAGRVAVRVEPGW